MGETYGGVHVAIVSPAVTLGGVGTSSSRSSLFHRICQAGCTTSPYKKVHVLEAAGFVPSGDSTIVILVGLLLNLLLRVLRFFEHALPVDMPSIAPSVRV